jgi:hypothetical protein
MRDNTVPASFILAETMLFAGGWHTLPRRAYIPTILRPIASRRWRRSQCLAAPSRWQRLA